LPDKEKKDKLAHQILASRLKWKKKQNWNNNNYNNKDKIKQKNSETGQRHL